MSKAVMWAIRKPHTDNIKNGNKWDEIRKRIPKDLTSETINYIYETKSNGGCGKVIGEFRVFKKTYIYAEVGSNGTKHLHNTAFIMPALSDEDLFNYLYDGKENSGWALRISDLKIYDKPKELGEFCTACNKTGNDDCGDCPYLRVTRCSYPCDDDIDTWCGVDNKKPITRPPQSWCYVEEV